MLSIRVFEKCLSKLSASATLVQAKNYSKKPNNILRDRYWDRNRDGSYKEYNESITVLPEEFKEQGLCPGLRIIDL